MRQPEADERKKLIPGLCRGVPQPVCMGCAIRNSRGEDAPTAVRDQAGAWHCDAHAPSCPGRPWPVNPARPLPLCRGCALFAYGVRDGFKPAATHDGHRWVCERYSKPAPVPAT